MQHFRYLKAWQSALNVAIQVRAIVARFPRRGYAEMKAQMTSSAESIGNNIAEGRAEASSDAEFLRFLDVSVRSAGELESQIKHAEAYGIVRPRQAFNTISSVICTTKLIRALQDSIRDDIAAEQKAAATATRRSAGTRAKKKGSKRKS